jgi:MerR family redox-sensitive transcriptional activator SoxR
MGDVAKPTPMPIADVARRAGVSIPTLRFYEQKGLITSQRTGSNRRCFPRHVLRRLAFIAAAQRLGLSLAEIREALGTLPVERPPTPKDWRRLSTSWMDRVDRAIKELEVLKQSLDSCIGCGCLSLGLCSLLNPEDEAAAEGHGSRWLRPAGAPETAARRY